MRTGGAGSRRVLATLAGLLVVAAACGSGTDEPAVLDTTTSAPAAPGDTGAPPATSSPGASGGGTGGATATTTGGQPGGAPGAPSTTIASGGVIPVGSLRLGHLGPPLLRPGRGDRVLLELRTQEGAAPVGGTISHLSGVLRDVSGKRVVVDGPALLPGGPRAWTAKDIVAAAAGAAPAESGRTQVVMRLLFLRGTYEGDEGVLGIAVAGDVAAVFSDQVDRAAGVLVSPSVIEDAVTMHEAGHLLGLVDLLLGTGRGDPDHPGHSRSRGSVMYWQVESGFITQLLDGGIPRDFDADDRAELAQIRAG